MVYNKKGNEIKKARKNATLTCARNAVSGLITSNSTPFGTRSVVIFLNSIEENECTVVGIGMRKLFPNSTILFIPKEKNTSVRSAHDKNHKNNFLPM